MSKGFIKFSARVLPALAGRGIAVLQVELKVDNNYNTA